MIKVYLANRPPLAEFEAVEVIADCQPGDIARIATETGNHWRKIFNVYAKLMYRLAEITDHQLLHQLDCWQSYRDQVLLQAASDTELHFPAKLHLETESVRAIHIIAGKAFSQQLFALRPMNVVWFDQDFAIDKQQRIIVCPYFDYRQLSNIKIERLAELILSLQDEKP